MVKVDLKDTYFTIPIHPDSTISSYACHLACPVLRGFHLGDETNSNHSSQYVRVYDNLHRSHTLDGDSPDQVKGHLEVLVFLLTNLGFIINILKSITRKLKTWGYYWTQLPCTFVSLPGEKLHHIRMEINQILQKSHVTTWHLAQIIRKLNAASLVLVLQVPTRRPTEGIEH